MKQLFFIGSILLHLAASCQQVINWEETKAENTLDAYHVFLANHPQSQHYDSALLLIVQKKWQLAKNAKSKAALDAFYSTYLYNANYFDSVKSQKELLIWENALAENTIKVYTDYLNSYYSIHGTYVDSAKRCIETIKWNKVKEVGNRKAFLAFLSEYPLKKYIDSIGFKLQFNDFKGYTVTFEKYDYNLEDGDSICGGVSLNFEIEEDGNVFGNIWERNVREELPDPRNYRINGKYNDKGFIKLNKLYLLASEETGYEPYGKWVELNCRFDKDKLALVIDKRVYPLVEISELFIGD